MNALGVIVGDTANDVLHHAIDGGIDARLTATRRRGPVAGSVWSGVNSSRVRTDLRLPIPKPGRPKRHPAEHTKGENSANAQNPRSGRFMRAGRIGRFRARSGNPNFSRRTFVTALARFGSRRRVGQSAWPENRSPRPYTLYPLRRAGNPLRSAASEFTGSLSAPAGYRAAGGPAFAGFYYGGEKHAGRAGQLQAGNLVDRL